MPGILLIRDIVLSLLGFLIMTSGLITISRLNGFKFKQKYTSYSILSWTVLVLQQMTGTKANRT